MNLEDPLLPHRVYASTVIHRFENKYQPINKPRIIIPGFDHDGFVTSVELNPLYERLHLEKFDRILDLLKNPDEERIDKMNKEIHLDRGRMRSKIEIMFCLDRLEHQAIKDICEEHRLVPRQISPIILRTIGRHGIPNDYKFNPFAISNTDGDVSYTALPITSLDITPKAIAELTRMFGRGGY